MYTACVHEGQEPKPFEPFYFFIDTQPDSPYEIFNIPAYVMLQAAMEVGFKQSTYQLQYASPEYENHEIYRAYKDECNGTDYLMRLRPNL